jgi:hypothetical protein
MADLPDDEDDLEAGDMEQSLQIHLKLASGYFGDSEERDEIDVLKEMLEDALDDDEVGMLDGWDYGMHECTIYMYGPDAEALWTTAKPIIDSYRHIIAGGKALLQLGPPERGTKEKIIPLDGGEPRVRYVW